MERKAFTFHFVPFGILLDFSVDINELIFPRQEDYGQFLLPFFEFLCVKKVINYIILKN